MMQPRSNLSHIGTALLLLSLAACGDNGGAPDAQLHVDADDAIDARITTIPTVISTIPIDLGVLALNGSVHATFSEPMDRLTLTSSTFLVTSSPGAVVVPGTVTYSNSRATFRPTGNLASNGSFTATITSGAKSAYGVGLAANKTWTFTTGKTIAAGEPVDLGTAENFVILAKSGISTVPTSAVTGNIGVSPAAATSITQFSLIADSTNQFARSTQVVGKVYAANYAVPTPANLTAAVGDMELALTDAAGRAPDVTGLGAGMIGNGMTLAPGVYKWSTGLLIPTSISLAGDDTAVWIFQIAGNLTVSNGVQITLSGGALPKNVFWQVSGQATFGTTSHLEGVVLCQTMIAMQTGSSINGRLLAQTAVTIASSAVTQPAP
jgi:hypothetical protein